MTDLQVDLHGQRIGRILGDNRAFDFEFDDAALEHFGAGSPALSVSVLVATPLTRTHRERRQNYFAEVLPEGRNREWLVSQAGLAYGDVLGVLRTYGRDIAGALEIWDSTAPGEPRTPDTIAVNDSEIAATLRDMAAMPLGNVPGRGASSVAGVQAKLVLARSNGQWHRPVGGYPSSHIVKPADAGAPASTIWDEEYGMRIARRLGLASYQTSVHEFDGLAALVIERYDRDPSDAKRRIHQEDFNQVLGASGDQKYQRPGGKVSLARIASVVKTHCSTADLHALARRTVAAVALGDLDMHAKNLSLLHPTVADVELAPAYDIVPHAYLVPDGEMALAVSGEYRNAALTRQHLVDEIASWHVRGADEIVYRALEEILVATESESPLEGAGPGLQGHVARVTKALLGHGTAGDAAR